MLDTGYWILDAGCWILDLKLKLIFALEYTSADAITNPDL